MPLLARLRALPVTSDGAGEKEEEETKLKPGDDGDDDDDVFFFFFPSLSPPNNYTPVPTRADLAALRRAAAVLPRYVEQLGSRRGAGRGPLTRGGSARLRPHEEGKKKFFGSFLLLFFLPFFLSFAPPPREWMRS